MVGKRCNSRDRKRVMTLRCIVTLFLYTVRVGLCMMRVTLRERSGKMRNFLINVLYGVMMLAIPLAASLHILGYDRSFVVGSLLVGLYAPVLIRSLTDAGGYTDKRGNRYLKQLFFAALGTITVANGWDDVTTLLILMICYVASYSVLLLDRVSDVVLRKR